jgi:hypothetical protein
LKFKRSRGPAQRVAATQRTIRSEGYDPYNTVAAYAKAYARKWKDDVRRGSEWIANVQLVSDTYWD